MKNQKTIAQTLNNPPLSYMLMWVLSLQTIFFQTNVFYSSNDRHTSASDLKSHLTIDVCGEKGKPIGVIHVYPPTKGCEGSLKLFSGPRKKAPKVSSPGSLLWIVPD